MANTKTQRVCQNKAQTHETKVPFVCRKVVFFWKVNSGKVFFDVW